MAMLGDVFLDVVYDESPETSVKSTDHPTERGEPISDHMEHIPDMLAIVGVVTTDAAKKLEQLRKYKESGELLTYSHRNEVYNVIIDTFNRKHDSTLAGAFGFTIRLKSVRISNSYGLETLVLPAKVQANGVKNKGTQQTMTPAQMAAANGNRVKGK
jgi:hypothetical protein